MKLFIVIALFVTLASVECEDENPLNCAVKYLRRREFLTRNLSKFDGKNTIACDDYEEIINGFVENFVTSFIDTSRMSEEESLATLEGKYLAMNGTNSECFISYLSSRKFVEKFLMVQIYNHSTELSSDDRTKHVKEAFEDMFVTIHSSYLKCTPEEVYEAAFNLMNQSEITDGNAEEKWLSFILDSFFKGESPKRVVDCLKKSIENTKDEDVSIKDTLVQRNLHVELRYSIIDETLSCLMKRRSDY